MKGSAQLGVERASSVSLGRKPTPAVDRVTSGATHGDER